MLTKIKRYVLIPTLFITLAIQPTFLAGCKLKTCEKQEGTPIDESKINFGEKINLVMWYVFEDPDVMNTLASQYKAKHSNVTITPIKYDTLSKYSDQLGLKSGTEEAPDIFFIRHDWLPLYHLKLAPITESNFKYDPETGKYDANRTETLDDYLSLFFPALRTDMVKTYTEVDKKTKKEVTKEDLYGIPWGFEGLALFVNTDHFNEYNRANPTNQLTVPVPNQTMSWTEFAAAAQKLIKTTSGWARVSSDVNTPTQIDYDSVVRYGAALGYGSSSVQQSADIFTTMLMQNGIQVIGDDHTTVEFIKGTNISAAVNALESYTSFSKLWDESWASSVESFAQGKVSMAFGSSYQVAGLEKISSLHFEVVPFPQRTSDSATWVTPAYYWVRVVNKDSEHADVAWDFIRFAASHDHMQVYSEITKIPPARQDLAEEVDLGSSKYNVFVRALPYVQTWYKGETNAAEKAINDAINEVAHSKTDAQAALTKAAQELEQILEEYQL